MEKALAQNDRARPPIVLHFDFKDNQVALLHTVRDLLGEYQGLLPACWGLSGESAAARRPAKSICRVLSRRDALAWTSGLPSARSEQGRQAGYQTAEEVRFTNEPLWNVLPRNSARGSKEQDLFFTILSLILKPLTGAISPFATQTRHICLLH